MKRQRFLALLLAVSMVLSFAVTARAEDEALPTINISMLDMYKATFTRENFGPSVNGRTGLNYALYSPLDFYDGAPIAPNPDNDTQYPVFIWLHGAGQGTYSGSPLDGSEVALFASGEYQAQFGEGAFIVIPRAYEESEGLWNAADAPRIKAVIDEVIATYADNIDLNRIYVGGFSMGGGMTWDTIAAYPTFFAAAFPICPVKAPTTAEMDTLLEMPIWIIHGEQDPVCSINNSIVPFAYLSANTNTDVKFSNIPFIYESDGVTPVTMQHFAWVAVTNNMLFADGTAYDQATQGYASPFSFINWLADKNLATNVDKSEAPFTIGSSCYDWGEAVTSVTINMREAVTGGVGIDTFTVTGVSAGAPTARVITGVSVNGNNITLALEASPFAGGQGIADSYIIAQNADIGGIAAGSKVFVQKGGVTCPEIDAFKTGKVGDINYRLYTPNTSNAAPLVLWLHGGGEFGTDNRAQISANLVTNWATPESQAIFGADGAYILAPQTPGGQVHNPAKLMAVLEEVMNTYNIDRDRIYVGGCSMGGMGTNDMISAYPEFFAAAFPICPANVLTEAAAKAIAAAGLPVYYVHATNDPVVGVFTSLYSYNLLKAAGSEVYLTLFDEVVFDGKENMPVMYQSFLEHFSWVYVHRNFDAKGDDFDGVNYHEGLYTKTVTNDSGTVTYEGLSIKPEDIGYADFFSWLAGQVRSAQPLPANGRLEAEHANREGAAKVETNVAAASNKASVGYLSDPTSKLTFRFSAPSDGFYNVTLRLAATSADVVNNAVNMYVNGVNTNITLNLPEAPWEMAEMWGFKYKSVTNYYDFKDYTFSVPMLAGENNIVFTFNGQNSWMGYTGGPNMDYIDVIKQAPGIATTSVENGNGQSNVNFPIVSANGKGYTVYLSETGAFGSFKAYSNVNYNSKGVHIKGLANGKTYYGYVEYVSGGKVVRTDIFRVNPSK